MAFSPGRMATGMRANTEMDSNRVEVLFSLQTGRFLEENGSKGSNMDLGNLR